MPPMPTGSPGEALLRQYTYLCAMAQQLNLAEEQLRAAIPAAAAQAPDLAKRTDLEARTGTSRPWWSSLPTRFAPRWTVLRRS